MASRVRPGHAGSRRSRRWLLPAAVLLLWLFVGGPLGSFAGQLADVQENDNAAFLPESAESTLAAREYARFVRSESLPAIIAFERESGLTRDDKAQVAALVDEVRAVEHVDADGILGPIPSPDGTAAQVVVPLTTDEGEELKQAVADIRGALEAAPEGLTAVVGGPGGILADFIEVFGEIDGLLLLVALAVVLVILLVVYRSPVLPFVVLATAVLALGLGSAVVYWLARGDILDLSGQSQGILFILVVGAATDYSLLIVARFREELQGHESQYDAMRKALSAVLEPIAASGATVVLGLLCLLFSDLSSLSGLGPVGAIGIVAAMLAALTLLPATLVLLGRRAFWPFRPAYGSGHTDSHGLWGAVSRFVGRRARAVWVATFVVLAGFAAFVPTLNEDPVPQTQLFLAEVESVRAQAVLDGHFVSDRSSPAIVVTPEEHLREVIAVAADQEGVARNGVYPFGEGSGRPAPGGVLEPKVVDGQAVVLVTLDTNADSLRATDTVRRLRQEMGAIDEAILVGGQTATLLDTRDTVDRDRWVVMPAILLVVFLVLAALLRSLLAPLILLVANVLSFGATIGVSALLFNHVFGFPGSDPSTMLIGFVFLVALGIDYSIFLMTRVREETLRQGTHPGILKGLSATGGVITSAGVVLAATFSALGVLPLLFLAQIAFIVAFGVLLDTIVVRSLLVPALAYDLGPVTWWPSRLWHTPDRADGDTADLLQQAATGGVAGRAEDDVAPVDERSGRFRA